MWDAIFRTHDEVSLVPHASPSQRRGFPCSPDRRNRYAYARKIATAAQKDEEAKDVYLGNPRVFFFARKRANRALASERFVPSRLSGFS